MPANKNKLMRMQALLMMMRQGRYPNYKRFMAEMVRLDEAGSYELSQKTFMRDIRDLREEFKAPVEYDGSARGYFLTDREWFDDQLMVEPFEMRSAVLGGHVASMILPAPLRSEILKAVSSLLMRNASGLDDRTEIDGFQVLNPDFLPEIRPQVFRDAYCAWESHRRIRVTYRYVNGTVCDLVFDPHVFAMNGGCWYIKGILHEDGEALIRTLAMHRIQAIEHLPKRFSPEPKILRMVREKGLFDFDRYPEVVLEVYAPLDAVIGELSFQRYEGVMEPSEGKLLIRLKNIERYQALRLFFRAEGHARIVSPPELRSEVCQIAERILEHNSDG